MTLREGFYDILGQNSKWWSLKIDQLSNFEIMPFRIGLAFAPVNFNMDFLHLQNLKHKGHSKRAFDKRTSTAPQMGFTEF